MSNNNHYAYRKYNLFLYNQLYCVFYHEANVINYTKFVHMLGISKLHYFLSLDHSSCILYLTD